MTRGSAPARVPLLTLAAALSIAVLAGPTPVAEARAELTGSSPADGSTVGGTVRQVVLRFDGLEIGGDHRGTLLDPAGVPVDSLLVTVSEDEYLTLVFDDLTLPGVYTVSYSILGDDGSLSSSLVTFRFDPAAPEPEPLAPLEPDDEGLFDAVSIALLVAGGAAIGYLAHRARRVRRARRARPARPSGPSGPSGATAS